MAEKDRIFLSAEEAVSAIRFDFNQYAPQTPLFLELSPFILGPGWTVIEDARRDGLWIAPPKRRKRNMKKISSQDLAAILLHTLAENRPALETLAALCEQIFQARAYPGSDPSGRGEGIWMETGMEGFQCRQCGRCCTNLDYRFELTGADYELWQELGRSDILEWVATFRRGGRITAYAIWVYPGTRQYVPVCPWLEELAGTGIMQCRIHSVKPEVCRQYPASRKHANMTGCPAFTYNG